ncbi:MAG: DUF1800 domain-containing protein [Xanthomonadales bacterium]|nr:DUF1800 domain-containing protein [Xanthomonadales bacterium]
MSSAAATASRRAFLGLPSKTARAKGTPSPSIFADSFESPAPPGPAAAIIALNRMAYGPRPGDIAAFNALGGNDTARIAAYVEQQLDPGLDDSACEARIAAGGYTTLSKSMAQLWSDHVRDRDGLGLNDHPFRSYPCAESECVKLLRAVYSRRQLYEVTVDFWHNHFNVQGWDFNIAPLFMHYDRDVIRPHAFGNFRALLEEVAKAPAMLQYLDNKSSRGSAYNENFARELCELHTLGVENYYPGKDPNIIPDLPGETIAVGYCDNDVYEAARALTGWTQADDHWEFPDTAEYDSGEFMYYGNWHDVAGKYFLHHYILSYQPDMQDAQTVFDILCQHPATALHICGKLCRRFISDDPPQALIDSAAAIWRQHWQSPDQITRVLRHILNSAAFRETWGEKVKRPWEALAHAMRATETEIQPIPYPSVWEPYGNLYSLLQQSGNRPFRWPTPDGYPDVSEKWSGVSTLAQTWRLMSRLTELEEVPESGIYLCDVVAQTNAALPVGARSANVIVDFWIDRIFSQPIPASRRNQMVDFLRQNAPANEALVTTTNSWNQNNLKQHYTQSRLRSAVALLFMTPEFYRR